MANQRIDLYTSFHKGIRKLLFDLLVDVGRTDFHDDAASHALCDELSRAIKLLHEHGRIEAEVLHTAIEARDAGATTELEEQHHFEEEMLGGLEGQIERIRAAAASERPPLGLHLYRSLGMFCSSYLDHLATEEEHLVPRFWKHFTDDELLDLRRTIEGMLTPAQLADWLTVVIPALDLNESTAMLSGVRANAPETFEDVARKIRPALSKQAWAELSKALGID